MSGDVQPRKRKDKKRKRDALDARKSEGEVIYSRHQSFQEDDEASHGVHITKMAGDDVHLHVHEEHGTGGHWCAKVFFFALLAVLVGLIGLIILENRGLTDVDTPLSESRFSNYFDGWVDEHREEHDDHDAVQHSIEEHDEHDEPFEEEEEHGDEDDDDEDADDDAHDEDDEENAEDNDDDETATEEQTREDAEDEDDAKTAEATQEDDEDDDEDEGGNTVEQDDQDDEDNNLTEENNAAEDDDDENDDDEEDDNEVEASKDNLRTQEQTNEDDDDDNDNDDNDNDIDDNDDDDEDAKENKGNVTPAEDDDNDDNDDEDENASVEPIYSRTARDTAQQQAAKTNDNANDDEDGDGDDDDDDDDDDGTFASTEKVVDNDAEELRLLQEKARQQAAKNSPPTNVNDDDNNIADAAPSWASSLGVKIVIGVALALVARLVLIRKNSNSSADEPSAEVLMKRRLTIAPNEVQFDVNADDVPPPFDDDEEYSEEEVEIEEEIEYLIDDNEEDGDHVELLAHSEQKLAKTGSDENMPIIGNYVPETFEQLNAMYKPQRNNESNATQANVVEPTARAAISTQYQGTQSRETKPTFTSNPTPSTYQQSQPQKSYTNIAPTTTTKTQLPQTYSVPTFTNTSPNTSIDTTNPYQPVPSPRAFRKSPQHDDDIEVVTREVTHDLDYQRELKSDELGEDVDDGEGAYDDDDDNEDVELDSEDYDIDSEDVDDGDDDEDDVSDVDDAELMHRLESKYGKLPPRTQEPANDYESDEDPEDPTWTQIKPKPKSTLDGGPQSIEEDFDSFERQLHRANEEMMRENYVVALKLLQPLIQANTQYPQLHLMKAKCLDSLSQLKRSNDLLSSALQAYKQYLAFEEAVKDDAAYRAAGKRCIERMRFVGYFTMAVPIHMLLIKRFPQEPEQLNELTITYLMANRLVDAKRVTQDVLRQWPADGLANTHFGYILKQLHNDYLNAIVYLQKGIDSKAPGTQEGIFYFNLGDALQRLGRQAEAVKIYQRGADMKLFPSAYQRSLYNVAGLRAQPYWQKDETTYGQHFTKLEQNWLKIRDEALGLINQNEQNFRNETENLRDTGNWQQFELFVRGHRKVENCRKTPVTCALIEDFQAARSCTRGQIKFSIMQPGTHVWPHCGPTNCRVRAHLGLVIPKGTLIRVANETRTWTEGEFLVFDDSFEHEVWHKGTTFRLVLIVDVWHPELSLAQRRSLAPI